jgi:hypothetical protein
MSGLGRRSRRSEQRSGKAEISPPPKTVIPVTMLRRRDSGTLNHLPHRGEFSYVVSRSEDIDLK